MYYARMYMWKDVVEVVENISQDMQWSLKMIYNYNIQSHIRMYIFFSFISHANCSIPFLLYEWTRETSHAQCKYKLLGNIINYHRILGLSYLLYEVMQLKSQQFNDCNHHFVLLNNWHFRVLQFSLYMLQTTKIAISVKKLLNNTTSRCSH